MVNKPIAQLHECTIIAEVVPMGDESFEIVFSNVQPLQLVTQRATLEIMNATPLVTTEAFVEISSRKLCYIYFTVFMCFATIMLVFNLRSTT